jgi:hypothetical protein
VKPPKLDFQAILRVLAAHKVDFVVVGGVCGALHGSMLATFDLDVVHSRAPENLDRLIKALDALKAHHRTPGKVGRKPTLSHLASDGHQPLMTGSGPLDLLGTIGTGHSYEDLLPESTQINIGRRLNARILNLPALIRIKEETATEKDKLALIILRRTLKEKLRK